MSSTFSEKLAAAKAAPAAYRDVQVVLNAAIAAEQDRLEHELESADDDKRLGARSAAEQIQQRLDELAAESVDHLITVRVVRLPGRDWANLVDRFPARGDVPVDQHYGYNYSAACEAAVRHRDPETNEAYAFIVEDGALVEVSEQEWLDLFAVLAGAHAESIRDAVYTINEYEPVQLLNRLVKGSGAATRSDSN